MHPSTFSIVAWDPESKSYGVAVQSKFIAVGAVVPWAKAGVGAIATQAWANTSYGPKGLDLLASGMTAEAVIDRLTGQDEGHQHRQIGVVDARGHAAAFTGEGCMDWAGHVVGENFTCQGNILAGPEVARDMAAAFEGTDAAFPERLIAALRAGQAAGGDRRGQQSAAILVVKEKGGYGGWNDRAIELRVEDHPHPIEELARVLAVYQLYFSPVDPRDAMTLEGAVLDEVARSLTRLGYLREGTGVGDALQAFYNTENFEDRVHGPGLIDRPVFNFLTEKAGQPRLE